jgi:hypothetical protein
MLISCIIHVVPSMSRWLPDIALGISSLGDTTILVLKFEAKIT